MLGHDVAYAEPLLTDFNPARVMSTLCKVHGHELLKDGLFNGDPSAARRPLYRGLTSTPPTRCHTRAGTPGTFCY